MINNENNKYNIDNLKYETYDNYIDSEIDWITNVPCNWKCKKFKQYVKTIKGSKTEQKEFKFKDSIPLLNLDFIRERNKNYFYVNKNDVTNINKNEILIVWDGAATGEFIINKKEGGLSSTLAVLRTKNNNYSKFLYYLNYTFNDYLSKNFNGMGIPHVNPTLLKNLITYLPTEKEIIYINKFLYNKTEKIDLKVSLLEKENQLLEELEKSIINQCVTKGVDSFTQKDKEGNLIDFDNINGRTPEEFDIYMNENGYKDSGIEWLGYVKEDFKIDKFKNIVKDFYTGITPESTKEHYFDINGFNWVTIGDLKEKYVSKGKNGISEIFLKEKKQRITPKNSLLFSFKLSIGQVSFTKNELITNEAIITIEESYKYMNKYLYYTMPIFIVKNAIENIYGAKLLNKELIKNAIHLNIPKKEQLSISKFLDKKTEELRNKREYNKKQIDLLKEYKKTLINDVVTGKIKVIKD